MNNNCKICYGKGFQVLIDPKTRAKSFKECECQTMQSVVRGENPIADVLVTTDELTTYVPSVFYQGKKFDSKELTHPNLPQEFKDLRYETYKEILNQLTLMFENGILPQRSYYINSPIGFGKKTFVYSSIQLLLKKGYKPTPLLHTHYLYSYLDKRDYSKFYAEFDNKDIVFLTLGSRPITSDILTLSTVQDECARRGIPLIVISNQGVSYLTRMDVMIGETIREHTELRDYGTLMMTGLNDEYLDSYFKYISVKQNGNTRQVSQSTQQTPAPPKNSGNEPTFDVRGSL